MIFVPEWVAWLWRYVWTHGTTDHIAVTSDMAAPTVEPSPELIKLYESLYAQENQAREAISTRLQIPLAIGVSLLTAQSYLFFAAAPPAAEVASVLFLFFLAVAFLMALLAGVIFFRVSSGHRYKYVPSPTALEVFRADCETSFREVPGAGKYLSHWVNVTMNAEVFKHYVLCTSVNGNLNAERSETILSLHRLLLVSISFTLGAFFAFALGDLKETPLHRAQVEIVQRAGPVRPVMMNGGIRANPDLLLSPESLLHWRQNSEFEAPHEKSRPSAAAAASS